MTTNDNTWPAPPATWPDNLTDVETCQYLRLDINHTVAGGKRSLRYLRQFKGLPCAGRMGGRVIYRRAALDQWLAGRESLQTPIEPGLTKETAVFPFQGTDNTLGCASGPPAEHAGG